MGKQRVVLAVGAASPDAQEKEAWHASEQWLPHALVGYHMDRAGADD